MRGWKLTERVVLGLLRRSDVTIRFDKRNEDLAAVSFIYHHSPHHRPRCLAFLILLFSARERPDTAGFWRRHSPSPPNTSPPHRRQLLSVPVGAPIIGGLNGDEFLPIFAAACLRPEKAAVQHLNDQNADKNARGKHRRSYTCEEKLLAIKYAETTMIHDKHTASKEDFDFACS